SREALAGGVRGCTSRTGADRERSMAKLVGPALEGYARFGEGRAHQRDWHQRCRVPPTHAAPPVEEDQPAVAAAFLDQEIHRDPRRVLGVVGLLEVVEGPTGEHHPDDRLAVARARDAADRALRVGPPAEQRPVGDAPQEVSPEPRPALNRGWSSRTRTARSTASSAEPPPARVRQPSRMATRTPARSSSRPSTGSAPAPPWTRMEGTRGPATRSRCGGMALTVSQSGRIAKRSRAAEQRDRAVSRLPAARRPSRSR